MAFVQLSGVSLAFGDRDILKEINFNLDTNSRTALAGPNGSGKSTLMKIMAGLQQPDSGERVVQKDTRVAYLPQSGIVHTGVTLYEEAERAFASLFEVLRRKERLEERLGAVSEGDSATEQLLLEHHDLQERLLASEFYQRDEAIQSVLEGLGFSPEDRERSTDEFSGGWQMRIALAKVLLERPDLLLLDEPTNYLDIEARTWLEGWLQRFSGGYLIVSHDRYFLDVTVSEVTEIWQGELKRFKGNYTTYERRRDEELEALVARYEAQQAEIEKVESFISRFRYNASKAAMVQSRIRYLEKLERIEIPESMKRLRFQFPPAPHSGKQVLELDSIGKAYGDNQVLEGLSLSLSRGEKLVIVGRNGAGKSTLMRIAAGVDRGFSGELRYGSGVRVGYFSQDMEDHLDDKLQVIDEIERDAPTHLYPMLRNLLGAFLFPGDDVYKQISVLSGGEKSRVALLKLLLYPANLLVLDEPTNHLDLRSKDVLLDALKDYGGTLIFVSHDRYFIEGLATAVLELSPAGPRLYPGDYDYYLWKSSGGGNAAGTESTSSRGADGQAAGAASQAQAQGAENAAAPRERAADSGNGRDSQAPSPGYEQKKRIKSALRRLEREQDELIERLDELEVDHRRLSARLAEPEVYADGEQVKETKGLLEKNRAEQRRLSQRWEEVAAELEAAERS